MSAYRYRQQDGVRSDAFRPEFRGDDLDQPDQRRLARGISGHAWKADRVAHEGR